MSHTMHRPVLLVLLLAALLSGQEGLKARFEALDDARDHAGIVALWKANPAAVLQTIDGCLEGALKLMEEGKPDTKVVTAMHERALRGALAADDATGRSIFSDYASSFIGWDADERKRFRAGQAAFGAYRKAMRQPDQVKEALEHATKCYTLAMPLGDWWGTAMGLTGMGSALEKQGKLLRALECQSRARLIYQNLGLRSELSNLVAMSRLLVKLDRKPRARVTIVKARALAKAAGRRGKRALDELAALEKSL